MIKGYKFIINEEEKSRILNLHQNRSKNQYLDITEQQATYDPKKDGGGPIDKLVADFKEKRKKKKEDKAKAKAESNNASSGSTEPKSPKQADDIYDAWSYETGDEIEDEISSGEEENEKDETKDDKTNSSNTSSEKEDTESESIPEDKSKLTFEKINDSLTVSFTYSDNTPLYYAIHYNPNDEGKYTGNIYKILIYDKELGYPQLYVYGKATDSEPDPTEISFKPGGDSYFKFQDLLTQLGTDKEKWDKIIEQSKNGENPTIEPKSDESQVSQSNIQTQFVPPKDHNEGISQITEKLKNLGYNTSNLGDAVMEFLKKNT